MDTALQSQPGPGHNLPPPLQDVVRDEVLASKEYADLLAAVEADHAEAKALPDYVTADADATAFGDVVQSIVAHKKAIDAHRDAIGRPYMLAKRTVDGIFHQLDDRLTVLERTLRSPLTAFINRKAEAERARRQEEARKALEAERKAREAAETAKRNSAEKIGAAAAATNAASTAIRQAAKPTADLARTRGQQSMVGAREVVTYEVDRATVDLEALRPYLEAAALDKAARAAIKVLGKDDAITGVIVKRSTEAFVR